MLWFANVLLFTGIWVTSALGKHHAVEDQSSKAFDEDVVGLEKNGRFRDDYQPRMTESLAFGRCNLDDFEVATRHVLGQGGYGQVFLGKHRATGKQVAIKQISADVLNPRHVAHEETIHWNLKHPFVARFHCTMKDSMGNVFFVIEYIPGNNLGKRISKRSKLSREIVQQYTAEIITALEFIHSRGIVYRDLKASNILISKNNHVKLIDFGLSVYDTENKLRGFAGTLEYAAPEMAAHQNYGRAVDFYSLGILVFKLVTGRLPISRTEVNMEKHEFLELIARGFRFPSTGDKVADDLIGHFCDRNPAARWGLDPAYATLIRQHPFFDGFDWSSFNAKCGEDVFVAATAGAFNSRHLIPLSRLGQYIAVKKQNSKKD